MGSQLFAWIDAHQWVVALAIFGLWPLAKHLLFDPARTAQEALATQVGGIASGLVKTREEVMDLRSRFALHRQEDVTDHAKMDGEMATLRERLASLPTQRDISNLASAIERMRLEIGSQLGAVSADVKVAAARIDGVHEMLERTQDAVDRHEQIISDAARRGQS